MKNVASATSGLEIQNNTQPIYDINTGKIGMISHKESLITIFGHNHKIKNFIKKIIFFKKGTIYKRRHQSFEIFDPPPTFVIIFTK